MKFKVGDEVRVVADEKRLEELGIHHNIIGKTGVINCADDAQVIEIGIGDHVWYVEEQDLELAYKAVPTEPALRTFNSGATRDTAQGKLDYVKALSPIVLRRYVQYLDKHRLQSDGSYRDFDNWKQGIPQETYLSSAARHFMAVWLLAEGYEVSDNHGPVNEEDALCGEIFNATGKLHEILKAKLEITK